MRASILSLALVCAAASLTACGVDAPSAPTAAAPELSHATQAWAEYDPDEIRRTGGTLFTASDWKRTAMPLFNEADKQRREGNTAGARVLYYQFLGFTLDKYKKNLLQQPSNFESARDGVFFIFASTLSGAAVAGEDPVVDNLEVVIDNVARNEITSDGIDNRYQLCVIHDVAAETRCGNPAGTAANILEAKFLARPALFLIEPWGSLSNIADFGSTWTGNWRMRVAPVDAQDAYAAPFDENIGAALTAICGVETEYPEYLPADPRHDFHPSIALLRVAQEAEADGEITLLEKVTDGARQLDLGAMLGGCHGTVLARRAAPPGGDSYLLRRGTYALHIARATLSRWMAPQSLYAVDGGLGGRTTLYRSRYAGVEPPSLYIRSDDAQLGSYGTTLLPATIPVRSSLTVYASQTAYGIRVPPASCAWTSSHARIRIAASGPGSATAVLSTTGSTGTAIVTANCTLTTGAQQPTSVTFTVGS